jgi:NAD(P)H-dependent flavin oxidoreductase YrpB (nitropropane dioxygenase family)
MTRCTDLTGCRVPVQQAPMGAVSTSALAVSVADATEITGAFAACPLCATAPQPGDGREVVGDQQVGQPVRG